VALEAARRKDRTRPLLFVVHSLGGIVVKEMLRRSNGSHLTIHDFSYIFQSTIGIVFFGSPHAGADPRDFLHHIVESVVKSVLGFRVSQDIVSGLLPSSEHLSRLRNEFGPLAEKQGWIIHSFQETFGVTALGGRKV
jgi:hypothetical protein